MAVVRSVTHRQHQEGVGQTLSQVPDHLLDSLEVCSFTYLNDSNIIRATLNDCTSRGISQGLGLSGGLGLTMNTTLLRRILR